MVFFNVATILVNVDDIGNGATEKYVTECNCNRKETFRDFFLDLE